MPKPSPLSVIKDRLMNSTSAYINDVTVEGEGADEHLIITLDYGDDDYRTVRVDVQDLGPDYLDHQ